MTPSNLKRYMNFSGQLFRGGSRTAATSKMERFVIIAIGWKPLTIITKRSILDVTAALDPPLTIDSNLTFQNNINPLSANFALIETSQLICTQSID